MSPTHPLSSRNEVGGPLREWDERLIEKRLDSPIVRNAAKFLFQNADPTEKGKFGVWLISLVAPETGGQLTNPYEDAEKVREVLQGYLELRKQNRLHLLWEKLGRTGADRDLNKAVDGRWITYAELRKAVTSLLGFSLEEIKVADQIVSGGAKMLIKQPRLEVIEITSPEASHVLCQGTDWCVRFSDTAAAYLHDGPLFLFRLRGPSGFRNHALLFFGVGELLSKTSNDNEQPIFQLADVDDQPLDATQLMDIATAIFHVAQTRTVNYDPLAQSFMRAMFSSREAATDETGELRDPAVESVVYNQLVILTDIFDSLFSSEYVFRLEREDDQMLLKMDWAAEGLDPKTLARDTRSYLVSVFDVISRTLKRFMSLEPESDSEDEEEGNGLSYNDLMTASPSGMISALRGLALLYKKEGKTADEVDEAVSEMSKEYLTDAAVEQAVRALVKYTGQQYPLLTGYPIEVPMTTMRLKALDDQLRVFYPASAFLDDELSAARFFATRELLEPLTRKLVDMTLHRNAGIPKRSTKAKAKRQRLEIRPVGRLRPQDEDVIKELKTLSWPGPKPAVLGAYQGTELVGVLFAGTDVDGEYVSFDVAVLPPYQDRGIGSQLIERFVDDFAATPQKMYLRVVVANETLIGRLEDWGFHTVDEDDDNFVMVFDPHFASDNYQGFYH